MDFDVIVVGAGIVGVSAALHLQQRGRRVALVDRRGPGEETSFGNAGLIESSSIVPYGFPRRLGTLLRYARNQSTDLYWDYKALPAFAGWLGRFWWESSPERLAAAARDMLPLIRRSVAEHNALIARAGLQNLAHDGGWIEAFRTPDEFDQQTQHAEAAVREHGLRVAPLDAAALRAREPALADGFCGALHWQDPKSIADPGALTKGYARLFEQGGGTLLTVFAPLGYRIPLRAKRGYHMHYRPARATLGVPVVDTEEGYVIAPMCAGLRLTTGVEIARREAAPTGIQLERAERIARPLFGLGERLDDAPWLGLRPCTPDMRPVIGRAPRHRGLWFLFGHNHHGLTLGPVSGRLLAELMTGATPFIDARPFRPERFG